MEDITVKVDGKEYNIKVEDSGNGKLKVNFDGKTYDIETQSNIEKQILEDFSSKKSHGKGKDIVTAPLPGTVVSINVKTGDQVKEGDSLLKLVAMKMENDILAEKDGIVKEVKVKKNDNVNKDDILIILD